MSGIFISFEGPDGAGKTTVIEALLKKIATITNKEVLVTREPGGSEIAEEIRQLILDPKHTEMDDWTEALLYAASRRQHLIEVIQPALAADQIVLCDRYVDSSIAYQGNGRQLGMEKVKQLNDFAIQGQLPQLTLYLDVPVEIGLQRVKKLGAGFDRLEGQELAFHQRVREAYLKLVEENEDRIALVDATQPIDDVVAKCFAKIQQLVK
ncbi:tmk protein [Lapidilactobacillus dextrinicus DSM 20335]|uniref:Thymidylate kinase n=1 Tax=Lapidilactobacillus dextrinicus DSM 20335 TaxID=1423738 RepID=A0A0R2BTV4_9LACO|nr:dTMP kinase [Lapidilactobacillus dextrinicus]KRM79132.1 tmk protein [Lapidilactobacillus dextrinicus DSM 20335]QFG47021.1 dTMP kinase [Lapidilactobacillus dextrinicus]